MLIRNVLARAQALAAAMLIAVCVLVTPATAGVGHDLDIDVFVDGQWSWGNTMPGDPNGDGTFSWDGQVDDSMWHLGYSVTGDPDPFLSAALNFTNNTSTTHVFSVVLTLPIAPPLTGSTLMGGSVGGSVTDGNGNGIATLESVNPGVYTALTDGTPVASLLTGSPFSISAPFAGGTAVIGPDSFGLPGPTVPGPAVSTSISIDLTFSLTPGDSAAFTAYFEVVPAPGVIALLGVAGLTTGRRRRRA